MVCTRFRIASLLVFLAFLDLASAEQSNTRLTRDDLEPALTFESGTSGEVPKGWSGLLPHHSDSYTLNVCPPSAKNRSATTGFGPQT